MHFLKFCLDAAAKGHRPQLRRDGSHWEANSSIATLASQSPRLASNIYLNNDQGRLAGVLQHIRLSIMG
jgi:hypothetical protein